MGDEKLPKRLWGLLESQKMAVSRMLFLFISGMMFSFHVFRGVICVVQKPPTQRHSFFFLAAFLGPNQHRWYPGRSLPILSPKDTRGGVINKKALPTNTSKKNMSKTPLFSGYYEMFKILLAFMFIGPKKLHHWDFNKHCPSPRWTAKK